MDWSCGCKEEVLEFSEAYQQGRRSRNKPIVANMALFCPRSLKQQGAHTIECPRHSAAFSAERAQTNPLQKEENIEKASSDRTAHLNSIPRRRTSHSAPKPPILSSLP